MKKPPVVEEFCEFCNAAIPAIHRHLLKTANREIICACDPCALRFQNVAGGNFRLIPRDASALPNFQLSDTQWNNLALPINLTFFYRDSAAGKMVAMYPSPAGATESLLPAENWLQLETLSPELAKMQPDVEALLINRIGSAREHYLVPIDLCYELVGLIRMHWRGLSGGEKVWQQIEMFFAKLGLQCGLSEPDAKEAVHA
ncbi:MAG TPA: DUF5947 family protein [Verrucomicrobiae bacterium]|jgi:hypothetical protein|nr:DUF5947 family protein [Verrucomicrobiae bacterium]